MTAEVTYGRAPWPTPGEMDEPQLEVYEALRSSPRDERDILDPMGRLVGTFNALLLDPPVGGAIQAVGAAIRFNGALTDRERELVILTVARAESSEYEWQAHVRQAAKYGVTDGEIACIGLPTSDWARAESEIVCLNGATDLLRDGDLTDEAFDHAVSVVGLAKVFDVVSVVGYYRLTALSLRVWRVPPRPRSVGEVPA